MCLSHRQYIPLFCAVLVLGLSACFNPWAEKPNPLGAHLSQTPASFTIQDGPFTYDKDVITNPDKLGELMQLLRKAKWEPAQSGLGATESLRLQLGSDRNAMLVFFAQDNGTALCQNSAGDYFTLDAKSYHKLHTLMLWAKGEVFEEGEALDYLWTEYLYDTYYTLGNDRGTWSSPQDLPTSYFAEYALYQYLRREYLGKGLDIPAEPNESGIWCDKDNENADQLYITRAAVSEYAVRYLNFPADYDPLAYVAPQAYDAGLNAFYIINGNIKSMAHQSFAPRVPRNDYDSGLEQVRIRDDGSISAVYARYSLLDGRRVVEHAMVYRLQVRSSTDPLHDEYPYYFTGAESIYVNNGQTSVAVGGAAVRRVLDSAVSSEKLYRPQLRVLAENSDTLVLEDSSYSNDTLFTLNLVDKESLALIKSVSPPDKANPNQNDPSFFGVQRRGDRIYARMRDRIISYSLTLEDMQELALPAPLLALKDKSCIFDAEGIRLIDYYGGYNFSADFSQFAYADTEGLKLLDIASGKTELLDPVIPQRTPMGMSSRVHSTPRFVDNGQKLLATYSGYESNAGWLLYDLALRKNLNIDGSGDGSADGAGNNGQLFISYDYDGTPAQNMVFTRFSDGSMHTLTLQNEFAQTERLSDGWYAINDRYAAFIVSPPIPADRDYRSEYWIHRLDLKTLETKERLLSVKGALDVKIWGVLEDGSVLYSYYYNPAEKEVGFVK